jgi:hypothetical protein
MRIKQAHKEMIAGDIKFTLPEFKDNGERERVEIISMIWLNSIVSKSNYA